MVQFTAQGVPSLPTLLGTTVQLLVDMNNQSANHMAITRGDQEVQTEEQMEKKI